MRTKKELLDILANWRTVVAGINTLSEEEAKWCLEHEVAGARRSNVVERLYGRFKRLRSDRELKVYRRAVINKKVGV